MQEKQGWEFLFVECRVGGFGRGDYFARENRDRFPGRRCIHAAVITRLNKVVQRYREEMVGESQALHVEGFAFPVRDHGRGGNHDSAHRCGR